MDGHDGSALSDTPRDGAWLGSANFIIHTIPILQRDEKRGYIGTLQCNAVGIQWDRLLHHIRSGNEIVARTAVNPNEEILYIHLNARYQNPNKNGAQGSTGK